MSKQQTPAEADVIGTTDATRLSNTHLHRRVDSATLLAFEFPPCYGGVSRLCGALARGLRRQGITTRLVTDARYGQQAAQAVDSVISVGPRRILREWAALMSLRRQPDLGLLISGIWYPEGVTATLAKIRPRVLLAHGSEMMPTQSIWRELIWSRLRRRTCEAADLIVANSDYTRQLVLKAAPRAKVVTIPLGVDHEQFCPGDRKLARARFGVSDSIVLSSVSRLQAYKGHHVVLRALALLPEAERRNLTYLVAGVGPYSSELRKLATALSVADVVRFLGFVPEEDLPDLYRATDLFVLCTQQSLVRQNVEGFGLVFLEAQACGTPVVGTRTGGIPDAILPGKGGWLLDQDDVPGLARILHRMTQDSTLLREAGLAARRRVVGESTWDHYIKRFVAALARSGIHLARNRI